MILHSVIAIIKSDFFPTHSFATASWYSFKKIEFTFLSSDEEFESN